MIYLGAAGTKDQAKKWTLELLPNISNDDLQEVLRLWENDQVMVRDPGLFRHFDATNDSAETMREIVRRSERKASAKAGGA